MKRRKFGAVGDVPMPISKKEVIIINVILAIVQAVIYAYSWHQYVNAYGVDPSIALLLFILGSETIILPLIPNVEIY